MFKLIKRLISIIIIAALIFLALSLWQGGKPFRWFGKKSEQAGETIREKSNEIGTEADRIKKGTEELKGKTEKVKKGIRNTGEQIKDATGLNKER
jgi:gas vesicle protein